jgi:autophagy-related protein 5
VCAILYLTTLCHSSSVSQYVVLCDAGGSYITLEHALKTLLPEFFSLKSAGRAGNNSQALGAMDSAPDDSATINSTQNSQEAEPDSTNLPEEDVAEKAKVKLVRVQGIELGMDIPFLWVANNLKNPEYYLHVCVYVGSRKK